MATRQSMSPSARSLFLPGHTLHRNGKFSKSPCLPPPNLLVSWEGTFPPCNSTESGRFISPPKARQGRIPPPGIASGVRRTTPSSGSKHVYRVIPWYNPIRGHGILILGAGPLVPSLHARHDCSLTRPKQPSPIHTCSLCFPTRAFINTLRNLPGSSLHTMVLSSPSHPLPSPPGDSSCQHIQPRAHPDDDSAPRPGLILAPRVSFDVNRRLLLPPTSR